MQYLKKTFDKLDKSQKLEAINQLLYHLNSMQSDLNSNFNGDTFISYIFDQDEMNPEYIEELEDIFADNFIISNIKIINKISIGLFLIVFIAIYIEEWDSIVMFITKAGLVAFILNVTMMVLAFYIAKFFATGVAQRRCISLEAGLQNGTLAVFVGIQLFGENMTYMVPTAAYALIMMTTSVIFVLILRKQT